MNTGWSQGRNKLDSGHQTHVVETALGLVRAYPALQVLHAVGQAGTSWLWWLVLQVQHPSLCD